MAVSSKKIHPPPRQGISSPSRSALTGSYRSKPVSGAGAQDMVYRRASSGVWIGTRAKSGEAMIREAIERGVGPGATLLIKGAESLLAVDAASRAGSDEFKRSMAALDAAIDAEVNGMKKRRPGFGIWADRKEDALEIEAKLRGEWA